MASPNRKSDEAVFERHFRKIISGDGIYEEAQGGLCTRLMEKFFKNAKARRPFEVEWMKALRQVRGVYDPEIASKIPENSSRIFPKVTQGKVNQVLSRLNDMLFPELDRNYSLEITPVPSISKDEGVKIRKMLTRIDPQTNVKILPTKEELEKFTIKVCEQKCSEMQREMDDQLLEMRYEANVAKPTLKSAVYYGTGVCKGPLVDIKKKRTSWEPSGNTYVLKTKEVVIPTFQKVVLWNWFPDMTVVEYPDAEGAFERHIKTKHDMRVLSRTPGFNADVIRQYLEEHPDGDYLPMAWEHEMEAVNAESGVEVANAFEASTASSSQGIDSDRKYQVLEYWGWIDYDDLQAESIPLEEKHSALGEAYCNIWLLGNKIIKAVPVDVIGGDNIFKVFYLNKDETSIFGTGLPLTMRHSALGIGSASRMILNNAAICSGPMFEINYSLIPASVTDIDDIYAMKVWLREGRGVDAQYPAVRLLSADSHINELLQIIEMFKAFADEETCLPTWMTSESSKTTNETAQGISMKQGTITVSLKDIVKNFDDLTEQVMGGLYAWNMEFNDNDAIKGDYQVKPRGSTTLVTKEITRQTLNQFIMTLAPEDWAYVPRRDILEQRIKANDLNIKLHTEEEADRIRQSQVDPEMLALSKQQQQEDIRKTRAMSLNFLSKAKKVNKEAEDMSGELEESLRQPTSPAAASPSKEGPKK